MRTGSSRTQHIGIYYLKQQLSDHTGLHFYISTNLNYTGHQDRSLSPSLGKCVNGRDLIPVCKTHKQGKAQMMSQGEVFTANMARCVNRV